MRTITIFKTFLMSVLLLLLCNMNALAQCTLSVNFEDEAWAGASYALRTVTDEWGTWEVAGVVTTTDQNDHHNSGAKSIRLRGNSGDNCHFQMNFDKPNGVGDISFYYASYSTHSGGIIVCYYSTDAGASWVEVGTVTAPAWNGAMIQATFPINIQGNVRVKVVRAGSLATGTTVNIDDLCLTDFNSSGNVATPTFTPPSGNYSAPQNVTINCATQGATIRYTTDGTDPNGSSPIYTNPINVSATTILKAIAIKAGLDNSSIATATYTFPIDVPNIAAFKAANPATSATLYHITGDVTFVFKSGRNIYIKDASGGLLIYDGTTPVITNNYNDGDVISGGVVGSCTLYNTLYELIPALNMAPGVSGTPVVPTAVTMENLLANFSQYESQLIRLENVTFDEGTFGTGNAGNIPIHQNGEEMICRNHYGNLTDYSPNPETHYNVIGFAIPYNADRQIAPRNLSDIIAIEDITPVENIINLPATAAINVPLTLTGTVMPTNATFKTITWSVKNPGTTGATIDGNIFTATATGTAEITATIVNGLDFGSNYTQDFTITVVETITYYTITATVNNPNLGTITPSGETSVAEGGSVLYTVTPYDNYKISDVLVNNVSQGAITEYKFEDVHSDGTIHVIFAEVGVAENELQTVQIYSYQNSIFIKNIENVALKSVEVLDMMGRLVYQSAIHNAETVLTLQVSSGIYNVRLISEKNHSVTTKISITN